MKITNITNVGVKPSKVDVVVNFNKFPKTFTLEPGQFIYIEGDVKSLLTQAMRVQKQKGLIDFTDENEVLNDNTFETSQLEEVVNSSFTEEYKPEERSTSTVTGKACNWFTCADPKVTTLII